MSYCFPQMGCFSVDKGMQNSIYRWQSGIWLSSIKASLLRAVSGPWENIWAEVCGVCTAIHIPPSLPPSRTTLLESFTAVCGFRKQMLAETPLLWGHIEDVTCMSCSVPCRSYSLKGQSDECMWHLFALSDFWRPRGKYALNSHISETRVLAHLILCDWPLPFCMHLFCLPNCSLIWECLQSYTDCAQYVNKVM